MTVAEQYDPTSISDIIVAQGQTVARCKQYSLAETLFIKAKRPDLALKMYRVRISFNTLITSPDAAEFLLCINCKDAAGKIKVKPQ